ncbi:MAG TPA: hypothetical protein ENK97_02290 [Campylobacteraceae bacterium]|nr:hypothetical protein [Campylobacteraceae bacterium]
MIKTLFSLLLFVPLVTSSLHAGIFDALFGGTDKKSDVRVTQSPKPAEEENSATSASEKRSEPIVEEEVISADAYIDSSDENDEKIFENETVTPPDEQAIAPEEGERFSPEEAVPQPQSDPFIKVKNILLSYTSKPEKIYIGQHIEVGVKAIIPKTDVTAIETTFLKGNAYRVFNPENPWKQTGPNSYENSFTLKLTDKDARLPNIKVTNQTADGSIQSEILKPFEAKIVALRQDELFCHVIADDLQVQNHQERPYDEQSNIVVMEINATGGNLEDFQIPYASREGIDDLQISDKDQKIYYFAVIPNIRKEFRFKYFNPHSKRYEVVSFAIKPIDTTISTHTELNPQKNKYYLYKIIILIGMALLFVLLFIIYRKYLLLAAAALFIVSLAFMQIPVRKGELPAGTALRILPISNSTVFFRTTKPLEVDLLLKKKRYSKVLLPNQKIGWVKNEAIR